MQFNWRKVPFNPLLRQPHEKDYNIELRRSEMKQAIKVNSFIKHIEHAGGRKRRGSRETRRSRSLPYFFIFVPYEKVEGLLTLLIQSAITGALKRLHINFSSGVNNQQQEATLEHIRNLTMEEFINT